MAVVPCSLVVVSFISVCSASHEFLPNWQDSGLEGSWCNCCTLALLPSSGALLTILQATLFYVKELMLNVCIRFVPERHDNSRIWLSDCLEMEETDQESRGVNWQILGREHNVINSVFMGSQARIVYIQCAKYVKIYYNILLPVLLIVAI